MFGNHNINSIEIEQQRQLIISLSMHIQREKNKQVTTFWHIDFVTMAM